MQGDGCHNYNNKDFDMMAMGVGKVSQRQWQMLLLVRLLFMHTLTYAHMQCYNYTCGIRMSETLGWRCDMSFGLSSFSFSSAACSASADSLAEGITLW